MLKPFFVLCSVCILVACGKTEDKPAERSAAGQAIIEHIEQPKQRAADVERQQLQAAEEARKKIDEASQ